MGSGIDWVMGVGPWLRRHLLSLVALALVITVTFSAVLLRSRLAWLFDLENLPDLSLYGYIAAFVVSLIGSGTVFLPAPSVAIIFALGGLLNPVLVGLVAGAGETCGELTGYLAGYSGRGVLETFKHPFYQRAVGWMQRHGTITMFLLSTIPNPIFDVVGVAAGAIGFPLWRFLVAVWLGKTLKDTIIALAGALGLPWLISLLEQFEIEPEVVLGP